jgi:phage-related protein
MVTVVYSKETMRFLKSLEKGARKKIHYNVLKVQAGILDEELFKKLEGTEIWEFRTFYNGISYRLLAFWDTEEDTLVVTTHGFIKKTQRTPNKEIIKAEKKRKQYYEMKGKRL